MSVGSLLTPAFAAGSPGAPSRQAAGWAAIAAALLAVPHLFSTSAALTTLCLMGIMVIFALSYNILLGQTGLPSFGHAAYFGLGGYVAIHAMNLAGAAKLWLPLVAVPLVGGLGGLLFGLIFGSFSTRRAGTTFAMISLGLAELVAASAPVLRGFFGGEEGITTSRTDLPGLFGHDFGPQIEVYYLIAGWCLAAMAVMFFLTRTPLGRLFNAVRDNAERAEFIGFNPRWVRYYAVCFSAFFAGIAGGLQAISFEIMNFSVLEAPQSGMVLLMTFAGGIGYFFGPVLGAVLITWLQVSLSGFTGAWQLYFGLFFVLVIMYAPGGLAGIVAAHRLPWAKRRLHRLVPAYLAAALPALLLALALILGVEMAYHLGERAAEGPIMTWFGLSLDASGWLAWAVTALLAVAGAFGLRFAVPRARTAWERAGA